MSIWGEKVFSDTEQKKKKKDTELRITDGHNL